MVVEIIITAVIAGFAIYTIVNKMKKKLSGNGCDCGCCSAHCPQYKDKKEK